LGSAVKLDSIREDFAGEIVLPDDPGYDQARAVWNGMADRRPALVVRPTDTDDVIAAIRFAREQDLLERGGFILPPLAASAVPADPGIAAEALRTIPPREQAGNVDIKQLGQGAHLLIPVDTPGGLFSAGDAHFAQGDCETCGTAIEMNATLHVRFSVRKGEAAQKNIRDLRFTRQDYYLPPEYAAPRRFYATTGISVTKDGVNHSEDITLAARNALLNMIEHLTERGWTRQQGYAICSVAVDLKISQLVDAPNMLVSAFLPEDIFTG